MGRLGLRVKFILIILAILLVIFGITGYFFVRNARITLTNNLNSETKAFASLATKPIGDSYNLYKDSGTLRINQEINTFTALDDNITNVAVLNVDGSTVFAIHTTPAIMGAGSSAANFDTASYKTNSSGQIIQVVQPYIDDNGFHSYAIAYRISTKEVDETIGRQELSILLFVIIGLLVSAVATYGAINQLFIRPIQRVSSQATLISQGYYSEQIKLDRHDEIGTLGDSVNHMADSLKANITKLQDLDRLKNEFITIISHNLRTPLTIIEGNISMIQDAKLSKGMREMVDSVENSAKRLGSFSEQMLIISNIEAGNHLSGLSPVSLADLCAPLETEYQKLAAEKKIRFDVHISNGDTTISVSKSQMVGALHSLLDNAFKFTAEGSVTLTAEVADGKAVLRVSDTGIGIKPEELPKLFTKFHRGTDVLTYNYEGTGIGLYATRLIVEEHGGTVVGASEFGHGATFTISLPLAAAEPPKPTA